MTSRPSTAAPRLLWYQFTVGGLFILITVVAAALAAIVQWRAVLVVVASVIVAAPIGVPLYFIVTMLNDKNRCTAGFVVAFVICQCLAILLLLAAIILLFVAMLVSE